MSLDDMHRELGICPKALAMRELPLFRECSSLVWVPGADGEYLVETDTALAWERMRGACERVGLEVFIVSAFRSYDYQAGLIRTKLADGQDIHQILQVVAAPGHSQHHTGRALDLGTPGSESLEEDFEDSDAFQWLCEHAVNYGFVMPYTRENRDGYVYEPWHWCYTS